jgi:hypothetical protein
VADGGSARWFDPRTGHWSAARPVDEPGGQQVFVASGDGDWVLDVRR